MGNGFVTDPGQLRSLATALFRLKGQYDGITVSSQAEAEDLGSLDVESGVSAIQTAWSRKKPEVGQLLDQLSQGVFAAAREYGWTEDQARKDAAGNPDGSTPGGQQSPGGGGGASSPGGTGSAAPVGGGSSGSGDPAHPGGQDDPGGSGDPTKPGDPTWSGGGTPPGDPTNPGDPSGSGTDTTPGDGAPGTDGTR